MIQLKTYTLYDVKNILFLSLFTFPILPIKLCNWIFIFFSIITLILFSKEKKTIWWPHLALSLLIVVPFLPYLFELIVFPHNKIIQFETEKKLLFFIAPFIFYCASTLKIKLDFMRSIQIFIGAVSLLTLISYVFLFWQNNINIFESTASISYQIRTNFESISQLHPSYYGLFSSISSLWLIYSFKNFNLKWKLIVSFALFLLISLNLLLASKMALFILFLGLIFILYKSSLNARKKISYFIVIIFSILVSIYFVPSLNSRLAEIPTFLENQTPNNTLVERQVIYNCNTAILRTDLLFGSGARNSQALLDYCYTWCGFHKGAIVHLNSHNQYFTLALNYGILLMILFCGILVTFIFISRQSVFANLFWLSILFIMLSESILERQMGIYYFLFFTFLFLMESHTQPQLTNETKG